MRTVPTALVLALFLATPTAADWLLYLGGGIEETRGPWEVRGRQVRFHTPGGVLSSVRADEVDLAASAFLSWQAGDRLGVGVTRPPVGAEVRAGSPAGSGGESPCVGARVVSARGTETLELEIGGRSETVHLACVDAPETVHRLPQVAWLGQQAADLVELLARPGFEVCVSEEIPPLRDRDGHRIVYLRLPDGRDLGGELVARGLALVRGGACARRDVYLAREQAALGAGSGHWGADGHRAAEAILALGTGGGSSGALPTPRRAARS